MSFIPKNPISTPVISENPPSPPTGARGLFAKDDGWYDIDVDGNIKKIGVTSYNDLADKPVQYIFDFENVDETLDSLTEPGIYCIQSKVEDDFTSDTYQTQYYVFVTINEGECLPVEDGDRQYKETKYSQLIVTDFMMKRREKIKRLYRDDNTEEVTEWEFVPLNDDLATKEYVYEIIKNLSPGGSMANSIIYSDIDNTFERGVYIVEGRDGVSDDGRAEMLIVSSSERGVGQFYFYDDGRIGYRQGSGSEWYTGFNTIIDPQEPFATKEMLDKVVNDLSKVATSGSYIDLKDKPIIVSTSEDGTHNYNSFTTEGIYVLLEPYKERYKLLIVTKDNDHYDEETGEYGYATVQYLFTTYDVTKRIYIKGKWTETTLASKDDVAKEIGDVEESLEKVIDKYSLEYASTTVIDETSTHSQKPTALAVKNYVDSAIGNALEGSY